jgi:hypothetical protein
MRANLDQRLKRLEARVKPASEALEIVIQYITPGNQLASTHVIRQERRSATDEPLHDSDYYNHEAYSSIPTEAPGGQNTSKHFR